MRARGALGRGAPARGRVVVHARPGRFRDADAGRRARDAAVRARRSAAARMLRSPTLGRRDRASQSRPARRSAAPRRAVRAFSAEERVAFLCGCAAARARLMSCAATGLAAARQRRVTPRLRPRMRRLGALRRSRAAPPRILAGGVDGGDHAGAAPAGQPPAHAAPACCTLAGRSGPMPSLPPAQPGCRLPRPGSSCSRGPFLLS